MVFAGYEHHCLRYAYQSMSGQRFGPRQRIEPRTLTYCKISTIRRWKLFHPEKKIFNRKNKRPTGGSGKSKVGKYPFTRRG